MQKSQISRFMFCSERDKIWLCFHLFTFVCASLIPCEIAIGFTSLRSIMIYLASLQ